MQDPAIDQPLGQVGLVRSWWIRNDAQATTAAGPDGVIAAPVSASNR
ncbi:hypothetical protein BH20CHL7_BH20CHL7_12510 [soil metagenome]